jgi:hypothetical protein
VESNTHWGYAATFTEVLVDSATQSTQTGNDQAGQYVLTESGVRGANFVDAGTDATGSFLVTESSTGSYSRTTTADDTSGVTVVVEASNTGYGMTETVTGSGPFTLTSSGQDSMTSTATDDAATGSSSVVQTGTDVYTVTETGTLGGAAFTDAVRGTDTYTSTETGNSAQQTYAQTTTGGGTWTRTETGGTLGSGSGTNGYTLTEGGDQAAGAFSEGLTGTDRYGLVEQFDDVSNTGSGTTPGNVTFHSHGLAFQDPSRSTTTEEDSAALLFIVSGYYRQLYGNANEGDVAKIRKDMIYLFKTLSQTAIEDVPANGKPADLGQVNPYELAVPRASDDGKGAITLPNGVHHPREARIFVLTKNQPSLVTTDAKTDKVTENTVKDMALLLHELVHAAQIYHYIGNFFIARYLADSARLVKAGATVEESYQYNVFEIDGYAMEKAINTVFGGPANQANRDALNALNRIALTINDSSSAAYNRTKTPEAIKLIDTVMKEFMKEKERLLAERKKKFGV